jgi:hypothetical protein
MNDHLTRELEQYKPAAYLNGTYIPSTKKVLININIVAGKTILGCLGPKSIAMVQFFHHFFTGKYFTHIPRISVLIFVLSIFDRQVRKAFTRFIISCFARKSILFTRISLKQTVLQQPVEFINGIHNLCDGCVNQMIYEGQLINSCRLDEYRMLGGPVVLESIAKQR